MKSEWIRHVGAALLYALIFAGLRETSPHTYWAPASGFRFSVLLLAPRRYWPALALGEVIVSSYRAIDCLPTFGWLWSLLMVIPPHIVLAMPIVKLCQDRWRMLPPRGEVRMGALLFCTLLVSLVWTVQNLIALTAAKWSPGSTFSYSEVTARWILGNDLGVLTVAPMALVVRGIVRDLPMRQWGKAALSSRLVLECLGWTLPALVFLVFLGRGAAGEELRQAARMAMFLPVVAVALRHGWQAVAVGGTTASIGVVLTMGSEPSAASLQAEVFVCFAISSMLLLGGRIALLNQHDRREQLEAHAALALAQRAVLSGDQRLRVAAESIEQIRDSVRSYHQQILQLLRRMLPFADDQSYRRQEALVQDQLFRLADRIHPMSGNERTFVEVLRGGSLARALDDARVRFHVDMEGRKRLGRLDGSLHLALYRVLTEVVQNACEQRDVTHVHVRIRAGTFKGRCWAVMRVDTVREDVKDPVDWQALLPRLTAMTAGLHDVYDQAAIYSGFVKEQRLPRGRRVSMMFYNPVKHDPFRRLSSL
jgi:glucose-6-phosphate-specific signal transduction histidine kinase